MQIREVTKILGAQILTGEAYLDENVEYGYGCDLMSDVLAFVHHNVLLLTGLVHPQVIRTAEMLDLKAVLIVRGKTPDEAMITLAKQKEIILLTTHHSMFTACALLYKEGLKGEEIAHHDFSL
jgi:predicted transcriptional regulator